MSGDRIHTSGPLLPGEFVEEVAQRVVELLLEAGGPAQRYLTAEQAAEVLGVSRSYVYDNAETLGAFRLGDGAKPRLRFELQRLKSLATSFSTNERPEPTTPTGTGIRRGRPRRLHTSARSVPDQGAVRGR